MGMGSDMRIAITGASGNVGTALLRRLQLNEGEHELVGVARRTPPPVDPYRLVTWHQVDVTRPDAEAGLVDALSGADAVVHLAWGFQPSHDTDYLKRLGVGGTKAVLGAVAAAGTAHLIHMSSVGPYRASPGDAPVDESWPADGVPSSPYSRHKAAAERALDAFEARHSDVAVARMRPGFILQREAASGLLRYGLPTFVPGAIVRHVPVLPLDAAFRIPVIHADDVARAIATALERRASGPFNLSADQPLRRSQIADALGARAVPMPRAVLRAAVAASWHARLQPLDPSWIDLAFAVPLLDTGRARIELNWSPAVPAEAALREVLDGMATGAHTAGPPLAKRTRRAQLRKLVTQGPIGNRPIA
jgi:UDP-glucose 4-epimerase